MCSKSHSSRSQYGGRLEPPLRGSRYRPSIPLRDSVVLPRPVTSRSLTTWPRSKLIVPDYGEEKTIDSSKFPDLRVKLPTVTTTAPTTAQTRPTTRTTTLSKDVGRVRSFFCPDSSTFSRGSLWPQRARRTKLSLGVPTPGCVTDGILHGSRTSDRRSGSLSRPEAPPSPVATVGEVCAPTCPVTDPFHPLDQT